MWLLQALSVNEKEIVTTKILQQMVVWAFNQCSAGRKELFL